ncbi:MAG: LysM peptidoglycan-binding domain-containing protein [Phycisphaerales bacterium]
MSNGARLTALFVVVAVAAVGLYLAFMTPAKPPHADPLASNGSIATPDREADLGKITLGDTGGPAIPGAGATGGTAAGAPGAGSAPATPATPGSTPAGGAGSTQTAGAGTGTSPTGGNVVPIPLGSGGTGASGANGGGSAAQSAATTYTVKSGDTLEGIARAQLGDGQKWRSIVELNPGLDPRALKIGQTIKLPAATAAAASKTETATPAGEVGSAAAGNTYTVQKGDTLVAISRKFYGSDGDWKRILEANAGLLKGNASALQPGMKLSIPAKR